MKVWLLTSSGTALILVKPFLKTMNTRLAPHRKADVAQSNAVSPAPRTMTEPNTRGSLDLHAHIPEVVDHGVRKYIS